MKEGIPTFDWQKPEVVPPYQLKQNPVDIEHLIKQNLW